MRFDYFVRKNYILYNLSKQIVKNVECKNNFYHLPPKEFEKKIMEQKTLINKYITETEELEKIWKKNKGSIYDYLFNIHTKN